MTDGEMVKLIAELETMKQLNENMKGGAFADLGVAKIRELETRVAQLEEEKEAGAKALQDQKAGDSQLELKVKELEGRIVDLQEELKQA